MTAHHSDLTLELPLLPLLIIVIYLIYLPDEKSLLNVILVKVLTGASGREYS